MPGRHTSGRNLGFRTVAALLVGAVVIGGAWTALALRDDDADPGVARPVSRPQPCGTTLRVVAARSYAPVLNSVAPSLETGTDCAELDVEIADGRTAAAKLAEVDADVWIPDDAAWAGTADGVELAPAGTSGSGTVLAESPLYLVADAPTAERVRQAGGGWRGLADLVTSNSGVRLVVRDPGSSSDGMLGVGALGEAVWLDEGMDASAEALAATLPATRTVLGHAIPAEPGEVGVVAEYALLPVLETSVMAELSVLAPADHSALLRYSWLPTAAGTADTALAAPMARVLRALSGPGARDALTAAALRPPGATTPQDGETPGLPAVTAVPYDVLGAHHVDHVFATWYPAERRSDVLVVVDVSGSMRAPAPGSAVPLIDLVREGVLALGSLLPDDSELSLWRFGSLLEPPRDYVPMLNRAPLTPTQRQGLANAVSTLAAQDTGTGLYDTLLAAYVAARDGYRPGVPDHVVLFTDGHNQDDPGSITVEQLGQQLAAAQDPARPVQLTVATFGEEPEAELIAAAVKPIGGYVDPLKTADDVRAMFVHVAAGGEHH